jgi:16S rRNA (cytosine1402-N4)-methyltransferase
MVQRVVALLGPALGAPGATLLDATLGAGGHSAALAEAFPQLAVIGIDRDASALAIAAERLAPLAGRLTLAQAIFSDLDRVLDEAGVASVQGVLFDLGVSSMQLDQPERGFAYAAAGADAVLDMRMDPTHGPTAADVVNGYTAAQLTSVLRRYADEPQAARIAGAIVRAREAEPITRTGQLADLVREALPQAAKRTGGHPAKRTFQALRIEVNGELEAVARAVPAAINRLAVGGRIAVLSYHSGEDRLVKRALTRGASSTAPPGLPVEPEADKAKLRLLTRGGEKPSAGEVEANPRAASARLRAAERIRPGRVVA